MTDHSALSHKESIIERARAQGLQITALREQVLDIVLQQDGVIKAYTVLAQMQQRSKGVVAPPTAYRALDFWAEHGVLHKVAAVNGYVLCSHARHDCDEHCHSPDEQSRHHSAFILVCTECGATDEQTLSREWRALRAGVAARGFKLKEEHVVLTGICKECQK
ncbi:MULTISPECIES: Fur family transcriptional regulator [Eikenella]|uniref:Cation uptake regulator n=1 Tax=Eikenella longinqua TaxID=1795827 RepID=A0A1A9RW75_9NEIS|nr:MULTISPECIES: Fur family transcriptional regulator [Eikenella]OAM26398.1 cation uptake regulator [Eikenella longinqua]